MSSDAFQSFLFISLEIMATLFIFAVGVTVAAIIVVYILDVTQTKQALRRNYPVIGHFRYFFEGLGKFFRQYFFAMDREEMPFNRAQRSWVYRAAKDLDSTQAFGSTRDTRQPGTVMFVNYAYPTLIVDAASPREVTIGPYCERPFTTPSLFNISGMSYGSISRPAVRALSKGARMAGCWMNTGEGGLSAYHLEGGADLVFQIGTAKYGVRDSQGRLCDERLRQVGDYEQVRMFEIKLGQGAKPGKGGILPGKKVTEEVARIRGIPVFEDSISPNRHPEIRDEASLLDMVEHIRTVTGKPTGIKTVIGDPRWFDSVCEEINRRGPESAPDFITIDGAEGGTGASPMSLTDYVGLSLQEALTSVVDSLIAHGLRDRVKVVASGKLINPGEVAWAICLGADFINSARGFMFSLGCIQAMQCNRDTCPTGITTHNPRLQRGLDPEDKALRVSNYVRNLVHEVGVIAHSCGVLEPRQLRRRHCRMVVEGGRTVGLDELFPPPEPKHNQGDKP